MTSLFLELGVGGWAPLSPAVRAWVFYAGVQILALMVVVFVGLAIARARAWVAPSARGGPYGLVVLKAVLSTSVIVVGGGAVWIRLTHILAGVEWLPELTSLELRGFRMVLALAVAGVVIGITERYGPHAESPEERIAEMDPVEPRR